MLPPFFLGDGLLHYNVVKITRNLFINLNTTFLLKLQSVIHSLLIFRIENIYFAL